MLIVSLMLLSVALYTTALKPGKKNTYFIQIFKNLKIWKIYKFLFPKDIRFYLQKFLPIPRLWSVTK